MSERILQGRTINIKYGISHEDGRLRFVVCGVDELPKNPDEVPLIFEQILNIKEIIFNYSAKEIIEYQKKEAFSLEAAIACYLIDYIKSGNKMDHVTKDFLETLYKSETVKAAFENIGYEATLASDKNDFFVKENSALSIIHEAFKINEESYETKEENVSLAPEKVVDSELDGDLLDQFLNENKKLQKEFEGDLEEENNLSNQELPRQKVKLT